MKSETDNAAEKIQLVSIENSQAQVKEVVELAGGGGRTF